MSEIQLAPHGATRWKRFDWELDPPSWMVGGQLQTLGSAVLSAVADSAGQSLSSLGAMSAVAPLERQRWDTPDGDFIDVDVLRAEAIGEAGGVAAVEAGGAKTSHMPQKLLVLFHGLEGSSQSHYARAFTWYARQQGWTLVLPHFRGCGGEINRAPRAYHCGDFEEIGWILQRVATDFPNHRRYAAGVSLGGNALLRWAEELGGAAAGVVQAVCAVCSPLDMAASAAAISSGFNQQVYTRIFLRTMKPRALAKWTQFPGLFNRDTMLAARNLPEFDDVFTGPLHGFKGVDDYYRRASSYTHAAPRLTDIRLPALVINAQNDPFVPLHSLPRPDTMRHTPPAQPSISQAFASDWVQLCQPRFGGHVGFASRNRGSRGSRGSHAWGGLLQVTGHLQALPQTVCGWFDTL